MGIDVDTQPDKGGQYLNSLSQYVNQSWTKTKQDSIEIFHLKFYVFLSVVQYLWYHHNTILKTVDSFGISLSFDKFV